VIVGLGLDLVAVARVDRLLSRHGERFLGRCFEPGELRRPTDPEHVAGVLAAKEAAFKALGPGRDAGIRWRDLVVSLPEEGGSPRLRLAGRAEALAARRGVTGTWLSITHHGGFAAAVVVLEA